MTSTRIGSQVRSDELPAPPTMASSAVHTVHVTVDLTTIHRPAAHSSTASLIYQTQPLDLHPQILSKKICTPVSEVTVSSFDLYTPPANPPVSSPAGSGPTWLSSSLLVDNPGPSSQTLSPSAIVGITLSAVAFAVIFIGLAFCLHRRRKAKKSAPVVDG